jgi:CubicO group peptidase (beta-lactamase class C family)
MVTRNYDGDLERSDMVDELSGKFKKGKDLSFASGFSPRRLSRVVHLAAALVSLSAGVVSAQSYAAVDAAVSRGISHGLYPGAVVVIGRRDTILYSRGYGHLTWHPSSPRPVPGRTLWDLASLTKVVATTSAVMVLADRQLLDLDAPVARYLPRFAGGPRSAVTVRMLLDHTSGLPAWRPFYRLAPTRDSALALLYSTPLDRAPGDSAVYSDLNAMLLGELVRTLTGDSLDDFVTRQVFEPLGMQRTMFRPPRSLWAEVAPSGMYRGRPVAGIPSDGNAARLGGVAGHAGLFSSGTDLALYAQAWLREGQGANGPFIQASTVQRFLQRTPASGSRLLGWDTPDTTLEEPSVFGTRLSPSAYGHTGWTGTEIWIDPAQDLFLVFLTNRSYRPRGRHSIERLRELRAGLSDAVVSATRPGCTVRASSC